ncbi:DNA polymerase III subunit gamma/tau [Pseudobacteroides cellulosolvens]|uniref:DNA-directed DNA polymerase n=1 Tax=Pseudobacteroides cellulosolvens ATCC 35603 = DSM 2933 TaxID=398512 RepID=A0A0L6JRS3_9FIRM|nr:DNA polymerase III subunit gamma/tau [Pseudobacteroides cellulosolvens]KNY28541.1 DNA polymerase III, subunits gamma and tau [Pseudobacteroides cellulosolvens ATCC 35603 = DSM 2933]
MSYLALYRKWRPLVFEDVVEQEHVVKTLKNSVVTDHIAHAYLFCGTRGTGKTTMAKIFSRAINCLNPKGGDPCNQCDICKGILSGSIMDVIEIDAASNNSVDNVREIRDEVIYSPSQAKFKVYIIDEVHMLSTGAFNALLKTLEEPPSHVVFILATTEPHKLPATILSRCQRYDFRRIPVDSIIKRLETIAGSSGVVLEPEASRLIAKLSDGALRDAISILDQCISQGDKTISYEHTLKVVGIVNDTFIYGFVEAIRDRNINRILGLIDELIMAGKDISKFLSDLIFYYRNLLVCKLTDKPEEVIDVMNDVLDNMKKQSEYFQKEEIMLTIREFSSLEAGIKWSKHPRILFELSLIKICDSNFNKLQDNIIERLSVLENKLQNGEFTRMTVLPGNMGVSDGHGKDDIMGKKEAKKPISSQIESVDITKVDINTLKSIDCWEQVIDDFRKMGRMVLYANLLDTKAVELGSKTIGVILGEGKGLAKTILSKMENIELIENALRERLGRDVRVKCMDEDSVGENLAKVSTEEDELVKKTRELADKFDMPIDIIDE